jgi:hypothetical protein
MPDAGCRMPDAGCRMPDADEIVNLSFTLSRGLRENLISGIWKLVSERVGGSGIWNLASDIWHPVGRADETF